MIRSDSDKRMRVRLVFMSAVCIAIGLAFFFGRDISFLHAWSDDIRTIVMITQFVLWTIIVVAYFIKPMIRNIAVAAVLILMAIPLYKILLYTLTSIAYQNPYDNISIAVVIGYLLALFIVLERLLDSLFNTSRIISIIVIVQLPLALQYSIFLQHA